MIRIALLALLIVVGVSVGIYRHANPSGNLILPVTDRHAWELFQHAGTVSCGIYPDQGGVRADILMVDGKPSDIGYSENTSLRLDAGRQYRISFDAKADKARSMTTAAVTRSGQNLGLNTETQLTTAWSHYSYEFIAVKGDAGYAAIPDFDLGGATGSIWIKNVEVEEVH
jgi:hypothetical protein